MPAAELEARILETLGSNPRRILIAGGDGSIRTAAQAVAGKDIELAVLPSGTLNHFAKDHGIPTDLDEAANGIEDASRQPELDAFIVDGCKITMRRKHARIALDGESEIMDTPLEYSFERDILRVVVADTTKDGGEASPSV